MQQLRQAVLRHVRMPLQQTTSSTNPAAAAVSSFWRGFAGGGYLDKDEVTQRVLHVTKHFEKIDPAKVRPFVARYGVLGRLEGRRMRCVRNARQGAFCVRVQQQQIALRCCAACVVSQFV
jgi:Fe2+ transport system protein FeoA